MISAKEARDKQKQINTEREKRQLKEIEDIITNEIKNGYVYYYEILEPNVLKQLISLGYEVKQSDDQLNGVLVKINW